MKLCPAILLNHPLRRKLASMISSLACMRSKTARAVAETWPSYVNSGHAAQKTNLSSRPRKQNRVFKEQRQFHLRRLRRSEFTDYTKPNRAAKISACFSRSNCCDVSLCSARNALRAAIYLLSDDTTVIGTGVPRGNVERIWLNVSTHSNASVICRSPDM